MRISLVFLFIRLGKVISQNNDVFNYGRGNENNICEDGSACNVRSFAQDSWGSVRCGNSATCPGFPDKFPVVDSDPEYGWSTTDQGNQCKWCPENMNPQDCGVHKQSPINLGRFPGVLGTPYSKDCIDWHYMQYRDDTCSFGDMRGQFEIARHALQIHIPTRADGTINCLGEGEPKFPRLDYSKGFPHWWYLMRTDIVVPSQHHQEGYQYDAEVTLAHFYSEKNHIKNEMGHVTIFLQSYENAVAWPFLSKLICQWRLEEEEMRKACDLPPAPVYGMCSLFRGQTRESQEQRDSTPNPTPNPTPKPSPRPSKTPSEFPTGKPEPKPVAISRPIPTTTLPLRPTPFPAPSPSPAPSSAQNTWTSPAPTQVLNGGSINCTQRCPDGNCNRMCSSTSPCCNTTRTDTNFCWSAYEMFSQQNEIFTTCSVCCNQTILEPDKFFAPARTDLTKTINCSDVPEMQRYCKADGCCSNTRKETAFCVDAYAKHTFEDFSQICHYCCNPSFNLTAPPPPDPRRLREVDSQRDNSADAEARKADFSSATYRAGVRKNSKPKGTSKYPKPKISQGINASKHTDEEEETLVLLDGKKFKLGKADFIPIEEDQETHFHRIYSDFKERHRRMQEPNYTHQVDYEDVEYLPYEWLVKVGTEYYFRYEGTQTVPPCRQVVHWRVMKDPIPVPKFQIDELNRLLAWRRNGNCEVDTAGILYDNGNKVRVNRAVQYTHKNHRMVFCECQDWPSKFESDKTWCSGYKEDKNYRRYYENPYSFQGTEWIPGQRNKFLNR